MKFKTKAELTKSFKLVKIKEDIEIGAYNDGIEDAFKSFAERVEFYKKYRGEFGWRQLKKDCPELLKTLKKFTFAFEQTYDDWLFDYCFGDVIE